MNKQWLWITVRAALTATPAGAQDINSVLHLVEQNNKELQAARQTADADKLEFQTRNNLEDPSVEYSPFYRKGVSGMASSELVVTQGFDFPTLYGARRQANKLQGEAIDLRHNALRQQILLSAKETCLDLIRLNQQQALLEERRKNADELLAIFEKRLAEGDAGILDVNKIKMERMTVQTEVAKNNADHRTALQSLLAMNGNLPIEFSASSYPDTPSLPGYDTLADEILSADASLLSADAEVRAAQKEVSVTKQSWLPKLEVGYRRNTELNEKSNGFLVGGSLPIFSNRKKKQIVRAQALGAQYRLDDARMKTETSLQSLYNEAKQLEEALNAYDLGLMRQTLSTLKEAVTEGQLSVIDYYTEAENVYRNMEAYHDTENRYQKVLTEIYKCRL